MIQLAATIPGGPIASRGLECRRDHAWFERRGSMLAELYYGEQFI